MSKEIDISLKKIHKWPTSYENVLSTTTAAAAAAKSLQSCLALCDPIDGSPL